MKNASKTVDTIQLQCGKHLLRLSERTHVMGILNITPDSFYDGGRYFRTEEAVEHALRLETEGADLIDIGGESTRPGAEEIDPEREMDRILPVIEALRNRVRIPLSVDTRKARVADAALNAGAALINDVSGLAFDPAMAEVAARYQAPVVLMHMRGTPKDMQNQTDYGDLVGEVYRFFAERIRFAEHHGIQRGKIVLDPGIGFAKKWEDNFVLLSHLHRFRQLGLGILVGVSRKAFIGKTLDLRESERLTGTVAAITAAVLYGAHIVRVHDVREAVEAVRIADRFQRVQSNMRKQRAA
jgi:dihydropteroate synthase